MPRQLEFEIDSEEVSAAPAAAPGRGFPLGFVLGSAPVWVPALLAAQILFFGLRPTQREDLRLGAAEADVLERIRALQLDEQGLQREHRMLEDPMYRERVRRSLLDPQRPPLTLARARDLAGW